MTEEFKEQLQIPLEKQEIKLLQDGDHLKITLSPDSAHKELILFKNGVQEIGDEE